MDDLSPDDIAIVTEMRRQQLLREFDRAQELIRTLEARLALVKAARADLVEQMRKATGGDD